MVDNIYDFLLIVLIASFFIIPFITTECKRQPEPTIINCKDTVYVYINGTDTLYKK